MAFYHCWKCNALLLIVCGFFRLPSALSFQLSTPFFVSRQQQQQQQQQQVQQLPQQEQHEQPKPKQQQQQQQDRKIILSNQQISRYLSKQRWNQHHHYHQDSFTYSIKEEEEEWRRLQNYNEQQHHQQQQQHYSIAREQAQRKIHASEASRREILPPPPPPPPLKLKLNSNQENINQYNFYDNDQNNIGRGGGDGDDIGCYGRYGSNVMISTTDAGTLIIDVIAPGWNGNYNLLTGGAFSIAWFSLVIPATLSGGITSALFMIPFWLAGGSLVKQTIVDPFIHVRLEIGEYAWSLKTTRNKKNKLKSHIVEEGSTKQLNGAQLDISSINNHGTIDGHQQQQQPPSYRIKLIGTRKEITFTVPLATDDELQNLCDLINSHLAGYRNNVVSFEN